MGLSRPLANVICAFVPTKRLRSRVRIFLMYPVAFSYVRFVRRWAAENCGGVKRLSIAFGVGCRNLIVLLNDTYAFKFLLVKRENPALREYQIVNALRRVSPLISPKMEIIRWGDVLVRKYDFVHGKLLCDFTPSQISAAQPKIAKQLAEFMYKIGRADPAAIRQFKPNPSASPDFMYGWFHNDIGNNCMLDSDMNIVGFIDSDKTAFCDFRISLPNAAHHWDKHGFKGLMVNVLYEYSKLYFANNKTNQG